MAVIGGDTIEARLDTLLDRVTGKIYIDCQTTRPTSRSRRKWFVSCTNLQGTWYRGFVFVLYQDPTLHRDNWISVPALLKAEGKENTMKFVKHNVRYGGKETKEETTLVQQ